MVEEEDLVGGRTSSKSKPHTTDRETPQPSRQTPQRGMAQQGGYDQQPGGARGGAGGGSGGNVGGATRGHASGHQTGPAGGGYQEQAQRGPGGKGAGQRDLVDEDEEERGRPPQ